MAIDVGLDAKSRGVQRRSSCHQCLFQFVQKAQRHFIVGPARRVVARRGPGTGYLLLEPVFAAEFSEVVAGLGVGVVFGFLHEVASNL